MCVKKGLLLVGVVALLLAAGLGFFWPFGRTRDLKLPGIVEIQEVRLGSKVGGRIAQLKIREGDRVRPGQELVAIEVPELENSKLQMQAKLSASEAEYQRARNGERQEEKDAAKAAADAARARYQKLKEGWREEEKRWATSELETADAELK